MTKSGIKPAFGGRRLNVFQLNNVCQYIEEFLIIEN